MIAFWAFLLDRLGYRVPWIERPVQSPALPLVRDGDLQRRNTRRELITEEELMSRLRVHGVRALEDVELAQMEGDGRISVVVHGEHRSRAPERRPIV